MNWTVTKTSTTNIKSERLLLAFEGTHCRQNSLRLSRFVGKQTLRQGRLAKFGKRSTRDRIEFC